MDRSELSYRELTTLRTIVENRLAYAFSLPNTPDRIRRNLLNAKFLETVQQRINEIDNENMFNFNGDVEF
ncbi:hypothetical protein QR680_007373 [Steinernema hermaphroditum]|uniref:Uncharacterized protein n=1 Tax=Steinernema hermaphroditum TaxID=289476 RepID=A0AA39IEK5_9BILA|nr:hypothetical protein QR680_007373 [Steinernema hermaphroditum]